MNGAAKARVIMDEAVPPTSIEWVDAPTLAEPLPPQEYLVPALKIPLGGCAPHCIAGYGFSGKTMVAQALALAVASGTPLFGVHPVKQGRVAHFDYEQGRRLTSRRYQRLARGRGINLAELGGDLRVALLPSLFLDAGGTEEALVQALTGHTLAIFDSLRAAQPNTKEIDSEFRRGLDLLGRVSLATNCAIVVLHHARKRDPKDTGKATLYELRGTSAIFDALDSLFVLSSGKDEPILATHGKARTAGALVDDFAVRIRFSPEEDALRLCLYGPEVVAEQREERRADAERRARDYLTTALAPRVEKAVADGASCDAAFTSAEAIGKVVHAKKADVLTALQLLTEQRRIHRVGKRGPYLPGAPPVPTVPTGSEENQEPDGGAVPGPNGPGTGNRSPSTNQASTEDDHAGTNPDSKGDTT